MMESKRTSRCKIFSRWEGEFVCYQDKYLTQESLKEKNPFFHLEILPSYSFLISQFKNQWKDFTTSCFLLFFFFYSYFFAGLVTITGTVKYIIFQKYNIIYSLAMMFFLTLTWHYTHTILHYYYRFSQLPCCCLSYFSHCIHWYSSNVAFTGMSKKILSSSTWFQSTSESSNG